MTDLWKLDLRRAASVLALTGATALIFGAGTPAVAGAAEHANRVTAALPYGAAAGRRQTISGHANATTPGHIVIERKSGARWRVLSEIAFRAGSHTFRVTWTGPPRTENLKLRVALRQDGRDTATTRARTVRVTKFEKPVVLAAKSVTSASLTATGGTLHLSGPVTLQSGAPVAVGVTPATPDGYLGIVTAVASAAGGTTVVTTRRATLEEAVPQGSLTVTLSPTAALAAGVNASSVLNPARTAASNDIAKTLICTSGGSASITGSLSASFGATFTAGWNLLEGAHAALGATATLTAKLALSAKAAASCTLSSTPILPEPIKLPAITVGVVGFPVVVIPEVQFYVDASASVGAALTTSAMASLTATAGIGYKDGAPSAYLSGHKHLYYQLPHLTGTAQAGAHVTAMLTLSVYGLGGPEASIKTGLDLIANTSSTPWWTLTSPLDISAGLTIPVLAINADANLYTRTFPLASATTPPTTPTPKPKPTTEPTTKPTPTSCHTLSASAVPLAELEAVYRTATRLPAGTPLVSAGVVYYGVCGTTYYAVDDIGVAPGVHLSYWEQVDQQDQEGFWSREGRGQWIDHGWYGSLCDVAPAALVDAWHIPGTSC
jgi:hypothetical protein